MNLFLSIALLLICAVVIGLRNSRVRTQAATAPDCETAECSSCSVSGSGCDKEKFLKAAIDPIEYFDDEELDSYRGRNGDSYNAQETEQFAYVLHTMRPDEVGAWTSSLAKRGINIPNELRDEVLMMIEDGHT